MAKIGKSCRPSSFKTSLEIEKSTVQLARNLGLSKKAAGEFKFLEDGFDIEELDEDLYKSMESAIKDNFERAMKMEMLEDFIWETYFEIG